MNLWPQTVALVANEDHLSALSNIEREWLQRAAHDAAARSSALFDSDDEIVQVMCGGRARFVNASAGDLRAMRDAFAPIYSRLKGIPQTKVFLDRIGRLKQVITAESLPIPRGCTDVQEDGESRGSEGPAIPDGAYRALVIEANFREVGVSEGDAKTNSGVNTLTIDGETWTQSVQNKPPDCVLHASYSKGRVSVLVGDPVHTKLASDMLLQDYGVYVQPINYPTVPKGTERLRFTPTPFHDDRMFDHLVKAMDISRADQRLSVPPCPLCRPGIEVDAAREHRVDLERVHDVGVAIELRPGTCRPWKKRVRDDNEPVVSASQRPKRLKRCHV